MTRAFVFALAGLLLASSATADPVNYAWGNGCWSENPVSALDFACDVNTGLSQGTVSFVPDAPVLVQRIEANVLMDTPGATPSWWDFQSAGCRSGALSFTADFSGAPRVACVPPPTVPSTVTWSVGARSFHVVVGPFEPPVQLSGGVEYYAFSMLVSHAGTVGADACAGCDVPLCLAHGGLWVYASATSTGRGFYGPSGNDVLTWNGYSHADCHPTPVRNRTWGQIKIHYR
jgi:hypothetical protein